MVHIAICRYKTSFGASFEWHILQRHEKYWRPKVEPVIENRSNLPGPSNQRDPRLAKERNRIAISNPASEIKANSDASSGCKSKTQVDGRPSESSSQATKRSRFEPYARRPACEEDTPNCRECKLNFNSIELLRSHNRIHHSFDCVYRPMEHPNTFVHEIGLYGHQRNQHAKIFPYKCKACIRSFQCLSTTEATHGNQRMQLPKFEDIRTCKIGDTNWLRRLESTLES